MNEAEFEQALNEAASEMEGKRPEGGSDRDHVVARAAVDDGAAGCRVLD